MNNGTLWKEHLPDIFDDRQNIDEYSSLGVLLGTQKQVFKEAYLTYLKCKEQYSYQPILGAKVDFKFDYQTHFVRIKRLEHELTLSFHDFQKYMGLIDAVFAEIYPIGTVVELDEKMLPTNVRELFTQPDQGLLVTIQGRKIPISKTNNLIDYIGSVWPVGLMLDVEPFIMNNLMVKKVVSEGLNNEYEQQYVWYQLRKKQLTENMQSYVFTDEFVKEFQYEKEASQ